MLGVSVPIKYLNDLSPMVDFLIYSYQDLKRYPELVDKVMSLPTPLWMTLTPEDVDDKNIAFQTDVDLWYAKLDRFIYQPSVKESSYTILQVVNKFVNQYCYEQQLICEWDGRQKNYEFLHECFKQISIPHTLARGFLIKRWDIESSDLHFSEFSTLDEIRRYQPASMHTNAPLTSALRGIDLAHRERRPKCLDNYLHPIDTMLPGTTLDLAKRNIEAIQEAFKWPLTL